MINVSDREYFSTYIYSISSYIYIYIAFLDNEVNLLRKIIMIKTLYA